jgi:N-acetylmuramoyl-L-alanine amidase
MRTLGSILLLACFSAWFTVSFGSEVLAQSIVIDPGHGGSDPGGTGNAMEESDIVLDTSERFRDLLEADTADTTGGGSWTVSMTRDTDVYVSLAGRSAYANSIDADRFMSIHANAFGNTTANGTETFSYGENTLSASLRDLVQEEMIDSWQLTNRGNKTAGFSVLRNTAMPAELHELGFITHSGDAAKLASPVFRQRAAEAHLRALQRHYEIDPYVPGDANTDGYGTLIVQVESDDEAVASALVTLDGEEVGSTDEAGMLELEEVPAGDHLLGVSKDGYLPIDTEIDIEQDEENNLQIELQLEGKGDSNLNEGGERCDSESGGPCKDPTSVSGGCNTSGGGGRGALVPFAMLLLLLLLRSSARRQR